MPEVTGILKPVAFNRLRQHEPGLDQATAAICSGVAGDRPTLAGLPALPHSLERREGLRPSQSMNKKSSKAKLKRLPGVGSSRMVGLRKPKVSGLAKRKIHALQITQHFSISCAIQEAYQIGYKDGVAAQSNDRTERPGP